LQPIANSAPVQQLNLILVRSVDEGLPNIKQVIAEYSLRAKAGATKLDGEPRSSTTNIAVCRCLVLPGMVWLKSDCDLSLHARPYAALCRAQLE
jgi:hypothetical protein